MWRCLLCGRHFANRKQWHSCGRFNLDEHLKDKNPKVVALFRGFERLVRRCGRVTLCPVKTRVGFKARMTFAAVSLKKRWLDAHVCLARRLANPRFTRIESLSPRNHVHCFRIHSLNELDKEVAGWLRQAYQVGLQEHLRD
jgi:hypothetical protein